MNKLPPAISNFIDAVIDKDIEYFERHPQVKKYRRLFVNNEAYPVVCEPAPKFTEVHQIKKGVRLRVFFSASGKGLLIVKDSDFSITELPLERKAGSHD